jgi:hypothetical protein
MEELIRQRRQFEDEMYDLLVSPLQFNFVPDSFWEPVRVSYNVKLLWDTYYTDDCSICTDNCSCFKLLHCCAQVICTSCAKEWFRLSVMCPYCNRDLRGF